MDHDTRKSAALKRAETVKRQRDARSPLVSMDAASVAWRGEQAHVDADIEGLPRDPAVEAFVAEMDRAKVPLDEQREHLIAYFRGELTLPVAAE